MYQVADQILIATSPSSTNLSATHVLAVGFISGTLARTVTSPLDVLKMLMQVSSKGGSVSETINKLLKEQGIKGFWRGNTASCIRIGPQNAIKNYVYSIFLKQFGQDNQFKGFQRTFYGALSGVISQVATYPLDVIRTRITVYPGKYNGIFDCALKMIKEEGPTSLFGGIIPTVVGVIPYEGAQFYAQGGLKNFWQNTVQPGKPITPLQNALIGSAAGMFSQIFSYPFELVRKRMMLKDEHGKPLYPSMTNAFKTVISKDGFTGLYRGFGINLIKAVPYAALNFTFKEETTKAFIRFNKQLSAKNKPTK